MSKTKEKTKKTGTGYWDCERFYIRGDTGDVWFEIVLNVLSVHAVWPWRAFLFGWNVTTEPQGKTYTLHLGPLAVHWDRER